MSKNLRRLLRLSLLCLAGVSIAWLAVLPVTASGPFFVSPLGNDANDCQTYATACLTVGAAITKASSGDFIIIGSGTYTESLTLAKNLTLIGFGSDATILSGTDTHRALFISAGVSAAIYDVAILHGNSDYGGGIRNYGALTLANSLLASNYGSVGGAIWSEGTLVVNSSIISGNVAGFGAAINNTGLATINLSLVQGNHAHDASGLANVTGTMHVNSSRILSNTAVQSSGGIDNGGILYVDQSSIANNALCGNACSFSVAHLPVSKAPDNAIYTQGAGILSYSGALTITNSTINGNNSSQGDFGGLLNESRAVLSNTTISGNTAGHGAGIFNLGIITLTNVTLSGNVNEDLAGYGTVAMQNTIVAGGGCTGSGINSLGHNLSSDNSCGLNATGDLTNTNPLLGPLQDNGGNTLTEALLPGSPAINAGTNSGCPAIDQRGISRPQGGLCDIGAYELVFTDTLFLPRIAR